MGQELEMHEGFKVEAMLEVEVLVMVVMEIPSDGVTRDMRGE